jgi:predicted peroxiredoxin
LDAYKAAYVEGKETANKFHLQKEIGLIQKELNLKLDVLKQEEMPRLAKIVGMSEFAKLTSNPQLAEQFKSKEVEN